MNLLKHIPNILTVIRLIFVPFVVIAIAKENYILGLILFTISSVTDVLDGIIARKFNLISDFGKLMDPLADKLTQISVLVTLTIKGIIPLWIIIVLIIKEVILISGAAFLYGKELVVSSRWYGKLTTVLMFVAVISSLLVRSFNFVQFDIYIYYVVVVLAIFSLISYIHYFYGQGYLPNKEQLQKKSTPQ